MRLRWAPATVLFLGVILTLGAGRHRSMPLVRSMEEVVPAEINGYSGQDLLISDAEAQVARFSNYLFRRYEVAGPDTAAEREPEAESSDERIPWFTLYVGFYASQAQGNTIHSPKNCLPGAGWEALSSQGHLVEIDGRIVTVNRYLLQNDSERALALYWYQGRGRVAHDEYRVKVDLLLDSALRRRSDEALVRIVVPVVGSNEAAATELAVKAAQIVVPSLERALPNG